MNLRLRFWLFGMDVLAPFYWRRGWPKCGSRAYLYCVEKAGDASGDSA